MGSKDGWEIAKFGQLVYNKGPTLIIVKTTKGRICGGYTSKNWINSKGGLVDDADAFVFSVDTFTKYLPTNGLGKGIYYYPDGICFGNDVLTVKSNKKLNDTNGGYSRLGASSYYNIEGD